jgi:hypothetical protein
VLSNDVNIAIILFDFILAVIDLRLKLAGYVIKHRRAEACRRIKFVIIIDL